MIICGVDDAGRGSLVGPLVVAGVSASPSAIKEFSELGVKDSKLLSPLTREKLYKKITKLADDYSVARIRPSIIDKNVRNHKLNHLEAKYMAKIISRIESDVSLVDACDVNATRFGNEIRKHTDKKRIMSLHKADQRFVIVSAASIIAKVTRDRAIARIRKEHSNDLGSGYPSDKRTVSFVRSVMTSQVELPTFVRASWKTIQTLQLID